MKNIVNALMISTGNVLQKDMEKLAKETKFSTGNYEYGCYIFVPDEEELQTKLKQYSQAFIDIIQFAIKTDCLIINFDADNELLPGFQEFSW